jgi:glutathione S-transferase
MRELEIEFREHLVPFEHESSWQSFRRISPTGKVPCLVDGDIEVWESLAIVEYLAERHHVVWPAERRARAWARSAAAEMHSGFSELRNRCSMSCGQRIRLNEFPEALERDIARVDALWNDGLDRFGGSFLAGEAFTAVDAFYAPVAFRIQTFGLSLDPKPAAYARRLLATRAMREWYADALAEKLRDKAHEDELSQAGEILEDLRSA